jgi:ABC-type transporter Mla subunit MlaD
MTGIWDASIEGMNRFGNGVTGLTPLLKQMADQDLANVSEKSRQFFKEQDESWKTLHRQVSTIISDLGKGIADLIFKGGSLKDVFVGALEEIGKAVLRLVTEKISGMLVKALDDLIKGKIPSLGKAFSDLTKQIEGFSKTVTSIFGGGKAAADATAGATGSATGAATGAARGGVGGIAGAIDIISGAVTAITSVLSFFQGRRMEQDIGRIEVTTRGILNQLVSLQESANKWWPWMQEAVMVLWKIHAQLFQISVSGGKPLEDASKSFTETAEQAKQATRALEVSTSAIQDFGKEVVSSVRPVSAMADASETVADRLDQLAAATETSGNALSKSLSYVSTVADRAGDVIGGAVAAVASSVRSLAGVAATRATDLTAPPTSRTTTGTGTGFVTIRFENMSARDQAFAASVIDQFVRGVKLTGQLV